MTTNHTPTPLQVIGGTWDGHYIRTARKAGRCGYYRGLSAGGRCPNRINIGDRYLEGEMNHEAGGYGNDRYCMQCAGDVTRAALWPSLGLNTTEENDGSLAMTDDATLASQDAELIEQWRMAQWVATEAIAWGHRAAARIAEQAREIERLLEHVFQADGNAADQVAERDRLRAALEQARGLYQVTHIHAAIDAAIDAALAKDKP